MSAGIWYAFFSSDYWIKHTIRKERLKKISPKKVLSVERSWADIYTWALSCVWPAHLTSILLPASLEINRALLLWSYKASD